MSLKFHILQLTSPLVKFPVFLFQLVLQSGVLFDDELVLELEIFSPAQSYTCLVEILLKRVAVILEPTHLAFVEVHVVLGGGVKINLVVNFLFEFAGVYHLTNIYYIMTVHHHMSRFCLTWLCSTSMDTGPSYPAPPPPCVVATPALSPPGCLFGCCSSSTAPQLKGADLNARAHYFAAAVAASEWLHAPMESGCLCSAKLPNCRESVSSGSWFRYKCVRVLSSLMAYDWCWCCEFTPKCCCFGRRAS